MRTEQEKLRYLAALIETGELLQYGIMFVSGYAVNLLQQELELMNLEIRELWYLTKVEWVN